MTLKAYAKEFLFSKHYKEDKDIEAQLAIDCIHCGSKKPDVEQGKFKAMKKYRKGELIVVFREYEEYYFVITAFWNKRGEKEI